MKVAIVHDWLNTKRGGGENVLLELAALYPEAPIYTLLFNEANYHDVLDPKRVRASWLQKLPGWLRNRSRYLLPLIPIAIESFDFSEYDVVISSSSAFAKGVITRPETVHICYCHTPMRFVWDYWPRYVDEQHVGPLRRTAIHRLTSRLRLWDYYSSARVDVWLANSRTTAKRIQKYYKQPSEIIYPGVVTADFEASDTKGDYYVTLGSLTPYKKFDMAIQAANKLGRNLTVIGDGADRGRLEALAGSTVTFSGRVSDDERKRLLAGAKAMIFASEEDFGIAPVEAMASGTPVIAYNRGGLTETVIDGVTGAFFNKPTVDSLAAAMTKADDMTYTAASLRKHAEQFDVAVFRTQIKKAVDAAVKARG